MSTGNYHGIPFELLNLKGCTMLRICESWYEGPPKTKPNVNGFHFDMTPLTAIPPGIPKIAIEGQIVWEPIQ